MARKHGSVGPASSPPACATHKSLNSSAQSSPEPSNPVSCAKPISSAQPSLPSPSRSRCRKIVLWSSQRFALTMAVSAPTPPLVAAEAPPSIAMVAAGSVDPAVEREASPAGASVVGSSSMCVRSTTMSARMASNCNATVAISARLAAGSSSDRSNSGVGRSWGSASSGSMSVAASSSGAAAAAGSPGECMGPLGVKPAAEAGS
mmetsp:Transcript_106442/g.339003  ORF Transcript_106442/g.339003 Transcript_106442/m.339003 type:complete len:204 (+) Transcript_106442:1437-2048(+)